RRRAVGGDAGAVPVRAAVLAPDAAGGGGADAGGDAACVGAVLAGHLGGGAGATAGDRLPADGDAPLGLRGGHDDAAVVAGAGRAARLAARRPAAGARLGRAGAGDRGAGGAVVAEAGRPARQP